MRRRSCREMEERVGSQLWRRTLLYVMFSFLAVNNLEAVTLFKFISILNVNLLLVGCRFNSQVTYKCDILCIYRYLYRLCIIAGDAWGTTRASRACNFNAGDYLSKLISSSSKWAQMQHNSPCYISTSRLTHLSATVDSAWGSH